MSNRPPSKAERGFTLIELMIVTSIIGVLASVAIPYYQRSIYRARQAEAVVVLGNLRINQWSYFGTFDCFANTEQQPSGTVGVLPLPWNSAVTAYPNPCDGGNRSLKDLGLEPSINRSYYQYQCAAQIPSSPAQSNEYTCSAQADLDGDGVVQELLFCTDQAFTGTGLASPQTTATCLFPYGTYRVSLGTY